MTHPVLQNPSIQAVLSQPYGRFSDQEFDRRRRALTDVMLKHHCDALVDLRRGACRHGRLLADRLANLCRSHGPLCGR